MAPGGVQKGKSVDKVTGKGENKDRRRLRDQG